MGRTFENLKGTYDYLPEKQTIREHIKSVLQGVFQKYGFAPIETPIICPYDLLASKYSEGADILKEMYTLTDQGKRQLGLRYDLTITFSKLISSNRDIAMPFKRYEIGRVYRDGPVKLGRNREFTQCDVDMVGVKSLLAEADYMLLTDEAYQQLGLDVEIEFNSRKLLSGLITCVLGDLPTQELRGVIMLVDKFAKLTHKELCEEFAKLGIQESKVDELSSLLNSTYEELKQKLTQYPENDGVTEGLADVQELYSYLEGTSAYERMKFAPYLARGIDVYTGMVWEIFMKGRKAGSEEFTVSIGGGGRYDNIITSFIDDGKEYPAVGMSFGLDVIYEALRLQNEGKVPPTLDVFIIPMDTQKQALQLAARLRAQGLRVDTEKVEQKFKKSMNYANKIHVPYLIVLGENEVASGQIMVKDMMSGESTGFGLEDAQAIAEFVRGGLDSQT